MQKKDFITELMEATGYHGFSDLEENTTQPTPSPIYWIYLDYSTGLPLEVRKCDQNPVVGLTKKGMWAKCEISEGYYEAYLYMKSYMDTPE